MKCTIPCVERLFGCHECNPSKAYRKRKIVETIKAIERPSAWHFIESLEKNQKNIGKKLDFNE